MVLQIVLGIVLSYIILSVGAAILWGVWSGIRAAACARAQEERKRKRESGWRAWRQDNPPQQRPTEFSAALVERWATELESLARVLDGSYDFGHDPQPDYTLFRAEWLRDLAKWLRNAAFVANASGIDVATWRRHGRDWSEQIDAACRRERSSAQYLDDPRRHWHAVETAETLELLSTWFGERAPERWTNLRASRPAT